MTDSEHPQRPMPSSPDDRLLDEFLERRGPVTRAWNDGTGDNGAPPELDAAVMAAAAAAMLPPSVRNAPRRRLQRWQAAAGVAATVVLGLGVVRMALYDPATSRQAFEPQLPTSVQSAAPAPAPAPAPAQTQTPSLPQDRHASKAVPTVAASPSTETRPIILNKSAAADAAPSPAAGSAEASRSSNLQQNMPTSPGPLSALSGIAAPAPPPAAPESAQPLPAKPEAAAPASASAPLHGPAAMSRAASQADAHIAYPPWHGGRWQGLPIGSATRDDVLRKYGAATIEDAGGAQTLMRYDEADPRGAATLYIEKASQALVGVTVALKPAQPLGQVLRDEDVAGQAPLLQVPGAAPCGAATPPLPPGAALDPTRYPLSFAYPAEGVILLLSTKDRVSEITYAEPHCH